MSNGTFSTSFGTSGPHASTTTTTADISGQKVSGTTAGSGSIGSLLALGKSLECNITVSTSGAQTEGLVYLSSAGKMRGDFSTTANGNVIHATTINDGTYVYSWTNLSKQGFKATVASSASTGAGAHGGVDNSTTLKYSCKPWAVDGSKFVPPSTVKF